MRWLSGVLSVIKSMVNGRTQASMGQTPQAQPGVSNTSAPTRGGKRKSQAVQVRSKPASKSAKRKPSAAQSTKAAPSRKRASKPAQTTSGKRGRPRKTPV